MMSSSISEITPSKKEKAEIIDLYLTLLSLFKISPEKDADGVSLIS